MPSRAARRQLALYRAGAWTATHLPPRVTLGGAAAIGRLVARAPFPRGMAARRAMVARHLQRVASYARYWGESLRLPAVSQAELEASITVIGLEHLDGALAEGRGVIAALPHLGGWDWGGRWIAGTGRKATVIVEPLRPVEVFEWFVDFRRHSGLDVVPVGPGAGPASLEALADNHILCLLSDRLVGGASGVDVEFFGEITQLPAGPATIGLRSGVPIVPIAVYFGASGDDHIVEMHPPLRLERQGRFRDDVRAGTQLLARELEDLIRKAPTQWHLLQPNWPSDLEAAR
jgi:lauroyl/myristoyl acyltransferase